MFRTIYTLHHIQSISPNKTNITNITNTTNITNKTNNLWLYVLKLINNKYYVGITTKNPYYRFKQHLCGNGAEWTKIHKPIYIIKALKITNGFEEDKYTKIYMDKYGIGNVRGGSYSNINLKKYQLELIKMELRTAKQLCFICGKCGHFAKNCTSK